MSPQILKNLNSGEVYKLYQSCRFVDSDGQTVGSDGTIHKIKRSRVIPDDFFDTKSADGHLLKVNLGTIFKKGDFPAIKVGTRFPEIIAILSFLVSVYL